MLSGAAFCTLLGYQVRPVTADFAPSVSVLELTELLKQKANRLPDHWHSTHSMQGGSCGQDTRDYLRGTYTCFTLQPNAGLYLRQWAMQHDNGPGALQDISKSDKPGLQWHCDNALSVRCFDSLRNQQHHRMAQTAARKLSIR